MNTTLKVVLIVLGVLFIGVLLLGAGFVVGRIALNRVGWMPMHWFGSANSDQQDSFFGPRMMGRFNDSFNNRDGNSRGDNFAFQMGAGMMGRNNNGKNSSCGEFQGHGTGMMWQYNNQTQASVEVLSIDQAEKSVNEYLASYGNKDLVLKEVMIFDNQAYAEIVEASTGIGAMEVLVDPVTLAVFPEYGPNMMWNQKYGHMRGGGMMGGNFSGNATAEMTVSPEEAVQAAQAYLDRYSPGLTVEDHVDTFYGYYTLHTLQDGQTVGMLSVNGYTAEVFVHTWHGKFVEMKEVEE